MINIRKKWISSLVFTIGIAFIAYGAYRNEIDTVFAKAVRVCMECIGLG